MSTRPQPKLSPQEYLAAERASQQKHEYFQGETFAMAGASFAHVTIVSNLVVALGVQLKDRPCRIFSSDLRVKVSRTGLYTYPDVGVVCDEPQFEDEHDDTLLNPRLIVEVLSASTESYDRGKKFAHYRTLESLAEYLLVSQDQPRIEQFTRQPTGDWLLHEVLQPDAVVHVRSIECELQLAEVYANVKLDEPA